MQYIFFFFPGCIILLILIFRIMLTSALKALVKETKSSRFTLDSTIF